MKKTPMWCLVGLLSLGSAGRSLAQGTRSTEEAVVRLEQKWFEARRSCEQLAPLLADKVLITESDGKVANKAEALESCKNTKWSLIRIKEMNMTVFGDTAIATGDFTGEGTDASGSPLRYMNDGPTRGLRCPTASGSVLQAIRHQSKSRRGSRL